MKAYWIWNHVIGKGIILEDYNDATYAATGQSATLDVSPIVIVFRNTVLDDDILTIQTIDMPEVYMQKK